MNMNSICLLQRGASLHWCTVARSLPLTRSPLTCFTNSWRISGLRHASNRVTKRLEKLGIGPDGKPLPTPNVKKVFPKMYKVLMVNQDGSTYTIHHREPHRIITLPLDLSTLTPEQIAQREKAKQAAKARVYVQDEELEEEEAWDQRQYKDLL